ncbi:MAG TPA: YebC/PmpR family DNA-binding transcriptional regulator, partial [bacterium]|nr:YebC/PmpR family DNA-binding transcriptional regulator [bacterium]
MSGHSKWATIKRKKEKTDAARGRAFTRLIKEITIAARHGGGDENSNPRLRTAVLAAKAANMPTANIERAVKRGTGELPGVNYEEITYEGYGPGGVAVYMDVLTDNKNRTVAEIRHLLSKYNGALGESGSVAWMFSK